MRIPLKLEYACRVLVQLVPTFGTGKVRRIEELGESEGISPNYLTQILNELRTQGIVSSRRGKHGGYLLAREPSQVSLLDIVHAVEGRHLLETNPGPEGDSGSAVTATWDDVLFVLETRLASVTIEDVSAKLRPELDFNI